MCLSWKMPELNNFKCCNKVLRKFAEKTRALIFLHTFLWRKTFHSPIKKLFLAFFMVRNFISGKCHLNESFFARQLWCFNHKNLFSFFFCKLRVGNPSFPIQLKGVSNFSFLFSVFLVWRFLKCPCWFVKKGPWY